MPIAQSASNTRNKLPPSFCSQAQIQSAFVSSRDKCMLSLSLMWCLQWHRASCNYSMKVNLYPEGFIFLVVDNQKRQRGRGDDWRVISNNKKRRCQLSSQHAKIDLISLVSYFKEQFIPQHVVAYRHSSYMTGFRYWQHVQLAHKAIHQQVCR